MSPSNFLCTLILASAVPLLGCGSDGKKTCEQIVVDATLIPEAMGSDTIAIVLRSKAPQPPFYPEVTQRFAHIPGAVQSLAVAVPALFPSGYPIKVEGQAIHAGVIFASAAARGRRRHPALHMSTSTSGSWTTGPRPRI